jgi:hypothetical protein
MKLLGLSILCVGVGIAAAFGARNTDEIQNRTKTTMILSIQVDSGGSLGESAKAQLEKAPAPTPPGQRFNDWFALAGPGFLAGIALIICGGLVTRRAIKAELANEGTNEGEKPVDFGDAINAIVQKLEAMVEEMRPHLEDWPSETRYDEVKQALEDIQLEELEPLLQTGPRLQALYGMAGFAAVFGPLSGAERLMNRAWSALVDRHWTEATNSLAIASENLKHAHDEIVGLSPDHAA